MKTASRLALAFVLVLSAPLAAALELPPPDETANFEGTWYYVDPGYKIAIFISQANPDGLSIHYHVQGRQGEEYETNDLGKAKYLESGNLVEIVFVGRRTAINRIEGEHRRTTSLKKGKVLESGNFEMWVTENGRKLVLHYPVWKAEMTDTSGKNEVSSRPDMYRLFRKASDIVVDFNEIKF